MKINIPNQITLGRLVLAIIFFVLLSLFDADQLDSLRWLLIWSFWVFLAASLGDVLDGLVARWLNQVTPFGRVIDPVVDKVMICGAFVFFAGDGFFAGGKSIGSVQPWMVVVILLRELLVSGIRAHAESSGETFGALWAGKVKMFVQSATVCVILAQLGWNLVSLEPLRTACVWLTVIVTALSIISYARRAHAFLAASAEHRPAVVAPPPPGQQAVGNSAGGRLS